MGVPAVRFLMTHGRFLAPAKAAAVLHIEISFKKTVGMEVLLAVFREENSLLRPGICRSFHNFKLLHIIIGS